MLDWGLVVTLLALIGFSLLAYAIRVLDAVGAAASFLLGLLLALGGGLGWLLLMAVFTGIAFVVTRLAIERKQRLGLAESRSGERGLSNVIGNGAAPALAAIAAIALALGDFDGTAATAAYATAVAAILADTMGSEVGVLSDRARRIIPPWPRAPAGQNGAVSLLGQVSTLVGAAAIAWSSMWLLGLSPQLALIAGIGGFAGGQIDSILGATLERDDRRTTRPLGKQQVNFLAAVIPSALVFAILV